MFLLIGNRGGERGKKRLKRRDITKREERGGES
jgi:hypothetical protein